MRVFSALLLLVLPAAAANAEARAWRGSIEVRAEARDPTGEGAREVQVERIELLCVAEPAGRPGRSRRVLKPRAVEGRYELAIDHRDSGIVTRGAADGRLHVRLRGWIDPAAGRYRIEVEAAPARVVAKTTMSGIDQGRFQTFRTVTTRNLFLASFVAEGELDAGRGVLEGTRKGLDRKLKYPREVTVAWRLERIDPAVRGRVVDHLGRPLKDLKVVATTTNAARRKLGLPPLRREGVTDETGRFTIEVPHGSWTVEVEGAAREGLVIEGAVLPEPAEVAFERAPFLEIEAKVYRLRSLPHAELLQRYFEGDVRAFLHYVRERVPEARLRRALVPEKAGR